MLTVAYGLAFASLGGFVAGKIAGGTGLMSGVLLAVVIALGATVSIIARPGAGALWTQTAALLLFAPAAVAGDWIRMRKRHTAVNQSISTATGRMTFLEEHRRDRL
jgi:hypothetical protein